MEHNVEINGVSICYEQQGGGRPVILLHGNGGSHHTFDGLIKRLSASYTVYAPDSRGHGHSGRKRQARKNWLYFWRCSLISGCCYFSNILISLEKR